MEKESEPLLTSDQPVLTKAERQEIEERLLKERDRAQEVLNRALDEEDEMQSESSGDLSKFPSHMADAGTQADEADTDFQVAERNSDRITRIDKALRRLRETPEAVGICQECGDPISMERLRIVPWTSVCARHTDAAVRGPGPRQGR